MIQKSIINISSCLHKISKIFNYATKSMYFDIQRVKQGNKTARSEKRI